MAFSSASARGERVLERGDLGLQRLGAGLVLGGHRLADLLGERVAALLRGLRLLDGGAAAVVDRRSGWSESGSAPGSQAPVERRGVLADPPDVVHAVLVRGIARIAGRTGGNDKGLVEERRRLRKVPGC